VTRKDYVLIAGAIRRATELHRLNRMYGAADAILRAAAEIADDLARDNPNFDRALFMKACGGPL
jgi:hypothetical protein